MHAPGLNDTINGSFSARAMRLSVKLMVFESDLTNR